MLASQQGHLRYQVQQIVNLRHAPQLVFLPDRQDDARTQVETLLDNVQQEEEGDGRKEEEEEFSRRRSRSRSRSRR